MWGCNASRLQASLVSNNILVFVIRRLLALSRCCGFVLRLHCVRLQRVEGKNSTTQRLFIWTPDSVISVAYLLMLDFICVFFRSTRNILLSSLVRLLVNIALLSSL